MEKLTCLKNCWAVKSGDNRLFLDVILRVVLIDYFKFVKFAFRQDYLSLFGFLKLKKNVSNIVGTNKHYETVKDLELGNLKVYQSSTSTLQFLAVF